MHSPLQQLQLRLSAALDEEMRKAIMRGASSSARKTSLSDDLRKFQLLAHSAPQKYKAHVVSSRVMRAIEKDSHPSGNRAMHDLYLQYAGMRITEKRDQACPCFAFTNIEDADRYLNGEVTEAQLLEQLTTTSKAT